MRSATIQRKTAETDISLALNLDGAGKRRHPHRLPAFWTTCSPSLPAHARFDLCVRCAGDTQVDDHHTVEDVGIALGQALRAALGDKRGVRRYGQRLLPMDEALALVAVDLSGRACLGFDAPLPAQKVGAFDTELVEEFFLALVREAALTLHIRLLTGKNTHHIIEGIFKAVARALREACEIDPATAGEIPPPRARWEGMRMIAVVDYGGGQPLFAHLLAQTHRRGMHRHTRGGCAARGRPHHFAGRGGLRRRGGRSSALSGWMRCCAT